MIFSFESMDEFLFQTIRVIGTSKNDVYINMKSPAEVKYDL